MQKLILFCATAALALACSDDKGSKKPSPKFDDVPRTGLESCAKSESLCVLDENGEPIAGAQVMVGPAINAPFTGNFLTAGEDGGAPIPAAWSDRNR